MIVDGWLDWAERVDGPAHKQFPQPNTGQGIACHSVVGNLPNHGIPGRFFDPADQASVMFILYKDGHVTQMYPVTSSTWTSGSWAANTMYWAIEAEGGGAPDYGEKLTKAAEDSFIRIVTEWENHTGRKALPNENILQHKQLVAKYGGGATACASDRYSEAWARVALGERCGDDALKLTELQTENLLLRVFAGSEYDGVETREQRLARALGELDKADTTQSLNDTALSAIAVSGGDTSQFIRKGEPIVFADKVAGTKVALDFTGLTVYWEEPE